MNQVSAHPFTRTDRSPTAIWWWTLDRVTLALVLILMVLGFFFSFSTSPVAVLHIGSPDDFYYTKRQFVFVLLTMGCMIAVSRLSLKGVKRVSVLVYGVALTIMALLPLIGHDAKGGRRWLALGPVALQPSEFLKPALIVLIAWMFCEGQKGKGVPGVTVAMMLYAMAILLLLIQPDVGQSILITIVFGACFFISGVPFRWIIGMGAAAVSGLVGLFFIQPHFRTRIMGFITPDAAAHFQVNAAKAAIANGGIWGVGLNEGVMKKYIPDLHTDFIYSVVGEEYGLWLTLIIIGIFAFIVVRGLLKAMAMQDPFRQIATSGLYIMLGVQVLINISVNLGLIPPKGMTLPFISYGGSSMLAMGLCFGFILALTRKRNEEITAPDDPSKW
ncbi:putative peptidoglycan glycosyltransferase FtsW [Asticcacaulis sp. EMRT-3]|uniref:FtsW/RodA/SpoVE family cell cycle protein n=1 Tax=Asticcacaulis sp. EMRT-3 TaxID=3040349 RepID=UPI0024AF16E6|nr:putative peptidoglycan glycosyltransferase FtsW [Asticcacaulis sp. EMRT-3]MDI7773747.1 putative peptidoglycan glycosyltransferase FtsW [Asticcacaulis sp. EMRT-3]